METSVDSISLDGYDLLEDAPVGSAAAKRIAKDTTEPKPQALAEPTDTLPATAPDETTTP